MITYGLFKKNVSKEKYEKHETKMFVGEATTSALITVVGGVVGVAMFMKENYLGASISGTLMLVSFINLVGTITHGFGTATDSDDTKKSVLNGTEDQRYGSTNTTM